MKKDMPKDTREEITPNLYQPVIKREEIDDSHYYFVDGVYFPGVTTILHETLPTPFALRQWIGDIGNEKAQQKLESAADRGTRIHNACESLLRGEDVHLGRDFSNSNDKKCVVAFADWVNEYNPFIQSPEDIEFTVASRHGFAGTLDIFCYINDEPWIIDIKTSTGIYESHKLQIVAYQQALYEMRGIQAKTAILHLNYRTKKGYSFINKIDIGGRRLEFGDFMKVFEVYKILNGGEIKSPPIKNTYPDVINLFKTIE
jgi:hypothetical protein